MSKKPPQAPDVGVKLSQADLDVIKTETRLPVLILKVGYLYQLRFQSELDQVTLTKSKVTTKRATVEDVPSGKSYVLLNAHYAFAQELSKYVPLTGRTFQIVATEAVEIAGGRKVYRYSIKPM